MSHNMDCTKNDDKMNLTITNDNSLNNNSHNNDAIGMAKCNSAKTKTNHKRVGEPTPLLYKRAARNLREYRGVPSMTDGSLEKTMALLRLRPARLAVQGLAPMELMGDQDAMTDEVLDSTCSDSSKYSSNDSSNAEEQQHEMLSNSTSSSDDDQKHDDRRSPNDDVALKDRKRPTHSALTAAGIKLRPRETRPLLLALGVRPHRLVKLRLVQQEDLPRSWPGGRGRQGKQSNPHRPRGRIGGHARGLQGAGGPPGSPQHTPPPHYHLDHRHPHGRPWGDDGRQFPTPTIHGPPPHGPLHITDHNYRPGRRHAPGREGEAENVMGNPFHDSPGGRRHLVGPTRRRGPPPSGRMPPHRPAPGHRRGFESDGEAATPMRGGWPRPPHGLGIGHQGDRPHIRLDHHRMYASDDEGYSCEGPPGEDVLVSGNEGKASGPGGHGRGRRRRSYGPHKIHRSPDGRHEMMVLQKGLPLGPRHDPLHHHGKLSARSGIEHPHQWCRGVAAHHESPRPLMIETY